MNETLYSPKISTLARRHFDLSLTEAAICDYLDWHVLNGESNWCKNTKTDIAKELLISLETCKRAFKNLLNKDLISKREGKYQYRTTRKWVILTYFNISIGVKMTYIENYEKAKQVILTRFERLDLESNGFFDIEENEMWVILTRYVEAKRVKMTPIDINKNEIRLKMTPIDTDSGQNDPNLHPLAHTTTTKEEYNNILSSTVVSQIGKRNAFLLKDGKYKDQLNEEKFKLLIRWLHVRRICPAKNSKSDRPGGAEYTRHSQLEPIIEKFKKHTIQEIEQIIEHSEGKFTTLYFDRLKKEKRNATTVTKKQEYSQPVTSHRRAEDFSGAFD